MIARHKYFHQLKNNIGVRILFILGVLSFSFAPLENETVKSRKGPANADQIQPVRSSLIEQDQRWLPMVVVDTNLIQISQSPIIHLPDPAFVMPAAADFRISASGGLGIAGYNQAQIPAVAYNSSDRQYLVVWQGDDDSGSKDEIYGRMMDAYNARIIGDSDFRIAEFTGNDEYDLKHPDIIYNSVLNEYLVVWQGVHKDSAGTTTGLQAEEIFGRRISAGGTLLNLDGTPGDASTGFMRISYMGTDDLNGNFNAYYPEIAFNNSFNSYLIVWYGDDDGAGTIDNEFEIFGQILNFSGNTLTESGNNFQISDMAGDNGTSDNDAKKPDVVFNSVNSEWFIVWEGEEGNTGEPEIYGQRLNADGSEINIPDHNFKISATPAPGNEARNSSVTWNSADNQYLVTWCGEGSGVVNEFDVFGKILNNDGTATGTGAEFRISNMGPDGNTNFRAFAPQTAYSTFDNEFLVIWSGDDDMMPLVDGEFEIFGQRITAAGNEVGPNDFRISDMGPDGFKQYGAHTAALTYADSDLNSYLTAWSGDDNTETVDDELEIFGRMISPVADISVIKTDGITSIIAGSELTYTITVFNNGPDDAVNTIVSDVFQPEFKNVNWTATGTGGAAGFETAGMDVIADTGIGLPAGATLTYTINTIVDSSLDQGTLLSNTVQVLDMLAIDPDLSNNQATDNDTEVLRVADLEITKTDNSTIVLAGDTLIYTIIVSNLGPVTSRKTTVIDSFPDEFTSVEWTAAGVGGASGFDPSGTGNIIDTLIFLPKGASVTYTAFAAVDPATENNTMLSNTASVMDSVATDPNLANNSATDDNTVVITDNEPPIFTLAQPKRLWPPNHKYVPMNIDEFVLSVVDSVDGPIPVSSVVIDSVTSDELENVHEGWEDWFQLLLDWFRNLDWGHDDDEEAAKIAETYLTEDGTGNELNCFWGDGYTFNDMVIGDDCRSVKLRAERMGGGNGRVYNIYLSVSDSAGNKADTMYVVTVPKSRKKMAVDDGPIYTVVSDCHEEEIQISLQKIAAPEIPDQYALLQNYPNPFNPETEIRFQLPEAGFVGIRIYNMLGQQIRLLTSQNYEAGYHSVRWNGRDARGSNVASGVYIYELRTASFVAHKKLVLTR